jgi:hypothetical protein
MKALEEDYAIGASTGRGRAVKSRWYAFRDGGPDHLYQASDVNDLWLV